MPKHSLPFTRAEYLDRIARTRRAMAEAKLDLLLVSSPENILWLSGYQAKGIFAFQVLIVPTDGDVRLVTRAIETGNVVCMPDDAVIDEFVTYGDTSVPTDAAAKLIGERYPRAKRIGVEKINQYFGLTRFEALRDALADAALVDASHLVDKCRLIKSPAEIECFRKAAAISDAAVLEAIKAVRVGVEDREIAAVAMASLIRHGSEYCSTWPNVMVGWRGGLAHAGWDGTKVTAGEPVAIEFAASVQRYHSPLFRTVIPGEPNKEIRRAAECAVRAHDAGLAVLKPGITIDALDRAIRAVVVEMDCAKYAHSRFGYTIGVAFPPTWAQSMPVNIVPGGQTVFEPNMMFHVMVYLLDPASFGIGVSETILITDTGIERLTKSPKAPVYM